jgi:hypothetical protein
MKMFRVCVWVLGTEANGRKIVYVQKQKQNNPLSGHVQNCDGHVTNIKQKLINEHKPLAVRDANMSKMFRTTLEDHLEALSVLMQSFQLFLTYFKFY